MTAIQKTNNVKTFLANKKFKEQMAEILPKHLTADRMARVAIAALTRDPKLAECTIESVFKSMMSLSLVGLEPDGRHAHLIPYRDNKKKITECQLVIDYKGLATLIMETGQVKRPHAAVVFENDEFEENLGEVTVHRPLRKGDRGAPYLAYCIIETIHGGKVCEVMTKAEIMDVKDSSPGAKSEFSPWNGPFWGEMWKKTVFKRAAKWVSIRKQDNNYVQDALAIDDGNTINVEAFEAHDNPPMSEADKLAAELEEKHRAQAEGVDQ